MTPDFSKNNRLLADFGLFKRRVALLSGIPSPLTALLYRIALCLLFVKYYFGQKERLVRQGKKAFYLVSCSFAWYGEF